MTLFGFILNGVILVLLGATIFFAVRLSLALHHFRENRAEMRDLVDSLSRAILQADGAIRGLREAAREGGRDLQETIGAARSIQDELRIMIESGDSLARRIESAVDRGRTAPAENRAYEPRPSRRSHEGVRDRVRAGRGEQGTGDEGRTRQPAGQSRGQAGTPAGLGFSIRDRDFDDEEGHGSSGSSIAEDVGFGFPKKDEEGARPFYSKAEQDLYEALRKKQAGGA